MSITNISSAKLESIRKNSVVSLPDEPSKAGYGATTLKERFVAPILNASNSLASEINRIVSEVNTELAGKEGTITRSDDNPLDNGIESPGVSNKLSRSDHVHKKDTTKADKDASNLTSEDVEDFNTKLGSSQLVAEVELTTATNTITINNLDLNADGGVYDVIVIGSGTENDLFLQVNNTTSNYAYALLGSDNSATRNPLNSLFTGQSHFKVSVGLPSLLISKFTISTDTNNISISGTGCGIRSSGVPLLNYTISYNGILPAVSNITSLIFSMSRDGTLYTGTKVKIYKRASNVATRS